MLDSPAGEVVLSLVWTIFYERWGSVLETHTDSKELFKAQGARKALRDFRNAVVDLPKQVFEESDEHE